MIHSLLQIILLIFSLLLIFLRFLAVLIKNVFMFNSFLWGKFREKTIPFDKKNANFIVSVK